MFLLGNRQIGTAGIVPKLRISSAESLVWTFHENGAQRGDHILAAVVPGHRNYSLRCKQSLEDALASVYAAKRHRQSEMKDFSVVEIIVRPFRERTLVDIFAPVNTQAVHSLQVQVIPNVCCVDVQHIRLNLACTNQTLCTVSSN